jgi:hypothetical protein
VFAACANCKQLPDGSMLLLLVLLLPLLMAGGHISNMKM